MTFLGECTVAGEVLKINSLLNILKFFPGYVRFIEANHTFKKTEVNNFWRIICRKKSQSCKWCRLLQIL